MKELRLKKEAVPKVSGILVLYYAIYTIPCLI